MAFDCECRGIPLREAQRLTTDAIATCARDHGLGAVYVVAGIETVPHRWRRHLGDLIVHMADGDDVLGPQFPDEARAAVLAAVKALLDPKREVSALAPLRAPAPLPPPDRTARA